MSLQYEPAPLHQRRVYLTPNTLIPNPLCAESWQSSGSFGDDASPGGARAVSPLEIMAGESPEVQVHEPSSEPLHIFAKQKFLNREL